MCNTMQGGVTSNLDVNKGQHIWSMPAATFKNVYVKCNNKTRLIVIVIYYSYSRFSRFFVFGNKPYQFCHCY